jgi:hypothetical protein
MSSDATLLSYENEPWDFGLVGDGTPYKDVCTFYDNLWSKLNQRYKALEDLQAAKARKAVV